MKRLFVTIAATLVSVFNITASATQADDGRVLTELWKKYEQAYKADKPQQEADILRQIKQEAQSRRLPVDFYDAATLYVSAVSRRDWKQRDALNRALEQEVQAFGHPMLTFRWMKEWKYASTDQLWDYVQAHREGFNGSTKAFWDGLDSHLGGALPQFLANDYEYVLWRLIQGRSSQKLEGDAICQALKAQVTGRYPNQQALAIYLAGKDPKVESYQALAAEFAGKAVALYPESSALALRMSQCRQQKADAAAYQALYRDAQALEARRKAFRGTEAEIAKGCRYPAELMETLTARDLGLSARKGEALLQFQNLEQASLTLRKDKTTLQSWTVRNDKGSFYVNDTVCVALPQLPDGDYTLEAVSGKLSSQTAYKQYTLSIATRKDASGTCVYVADYLSGEPLPTATVLLLKSGAEIARTTLNLDGFTPLPDALCRTVAADKYTFQLQAVQGDRLSGAVNVPRTYGADPGNYRLRCQIYKDRGAYHPGDTLQYKAIVFEGDPAARLSVCKGRQVEVLLHDSQDKVLASQKLSTNEFGSVSGRFVIPEGIRGGRFELEVKGLGYDWFRVDEFVLPSFDLTFDPLDSLYLVGDSVPVSGRITSYSAHSLSGARLSIRVSRYDKPVLEASQTLGAENRFCFRFTAPESGYYEAEVKLTDTTGETLSFHESYAIHNSLSVSETLPDAQEADWSPSGYLIESKILQMILQAQDGSGRQVPLPVNYSLASSDGTVFASGEAASGELLKLQLPAPGLYTVKTCVEASREGKSPIKGEREFTVLCLPQDASTLPEGVKRLFQGGPLSVAAGSSVTARLGSNLGSVHAVISLYGQNRRLLESRQIKIEKGKLSSIAFAYKASWPDAVRLQVFYFQEGESCSYDREYRREKDRYELPLQFTRFHDQAYPASRYSFALKTAPGTEVLVAAWDKSLDAVMENEWPTVNLRDFSVENVSVSSVCGKVGGSSFGPIILRSTALMTKNRLGSADAAEEAVAFQLVEQKPAFGDVGSAVPVRSVFSSALTFQPHLRPGADGTLNVDFTTSDKLSTYYLGVYAHDASMHNALLKREMLVSIPVKISIQEPRYLYAGDVYEAAVTVSSVAAQAVSGTLRLQYGDAAQQLALSVPAGGTATRRFTIALPSAVQERSSLELTASFLADKFSDAVRLSVPLYPAAQQLTESHSAVLRAGVDREALLQELRSRFVNVPASQAALRDISVLDMVREAIPSHVEPAADDVLSLSEAWYVQLLAGRLSQAVSPAQAELLPRILACRNADGGFGWFEGMNSSARVTAVLLERFAKLRDRGFEVPELKASVEYLDACQFAQNQSSWHSISMQQYLYLRSLYPEVPFQYKPVSQTGKQQLKDFRKSAKAYLLPGKAAGRGLQGRILAKARRLLTLRNLLQREGGAQLASAWGLGCLRRMNRSLAADSASLLEYAVEHPDGGTYYPNAVMPWRGLLESEVYAHTLLCELFKNDSPQGAGLSDKIRLWLMLQKETQQWGSDPAFVDAITAVLDGSSAVLETRVLALSASYEAPFAAVQESGNGMSISRKFFRDGVEIQPGDELKLGDKLEVRYSIWNAENRSFVRLRAGREAALRPVQQLSGRIGFGIIRPLGRGWSWSFHPQGYRSVKAAFTEYYFDVYPEEHTELTEEFFVTQSGRFQAPVVVIESLYAPHYRANSAFRPALVARYE